MTSLNKRDDAATNVKQTETDAGDVTTMALNWTKTRLSTLAVSLLLRPSCLLGVFHFALLHVTSTGQKSGMTLMNLAVVCDSSNIFMTTPLKLIPTHSVP